MISIINMFKVFAFWLVNIHDHLFYVLVWICRKIHSQMGVVRKIDCHHLVQWPLSQTAFLMIVVQTSHYCHHQVRLLHHQICHTLLRCTCCASLWFVVVTDTACCLAIGLAMAACTISIRSRQKKSIRVVPFPCSVQANALECFYNKLVLECITWSLHNLALLM